MVCLVNVIGSEAKYAKSSELQNMYLLCIYRSLIRYLRHLGKKNRQKRGLLTTPYTVLALCKVYAAHSHFRRRTRPVVSCQDPGDLCNAKLISSTFSVTLLGAQQQQLQNKQTTCHVFQLVRSMASSSAGAFPETLRTEGMKFPWAAAPDIS